MFLLISVTILIAFERVSSLICIPYVKRINSEIVFQGKFSSLKIGFAIARVQTIFLEIVMFLDEGLTRETSNRIQSKLLQRICKLTIYPSFYLIIYLFLYLYIHLFIHLYIHISIYLPIYSSIYLPIYLSIHISKSLSICISMYISIYHLSKHILSIYQSKYIYDCLYGKASFL